MVVILLPPIQVTFDELAFPHSDFERKLKVRFSEIDETI
jgi:hypothetical protein